jgi:hypothetical protein
VIWVCRRMCYQSCAHLCLGFICLPVHKSRTLNQLQIAGSSIFVAGHVPTGHWKASANCWNPASGKFTRLFASQEHNMSFEHNSNQANRLQNVRLIGAVRVGAEQHLRVIRALHLAPRLSVAQEEDAVVRLTHDTRQLRVWSVLALMSARRNASDEGMQLSKRQNVIQTYSVNAR